MTVNQRLKKYIDVNDLSLVDFGKSIGTSRQNVGNWVNSGTKISMEMLKRILIAYKDINARWLITGEGEMLESGRFDMVEEPQASYGGDLLSELIKSSNEVGRLSEKLKQAEKELAKYRSGGSSQDPVTKEARAG